jgi:uncharacterized membrane protein
MTAEGSSATRPWLLVLAYIPVLGFVVLLASRDREARWHARNGLLLFAAVAATGAVATIIGILAPSLACLYAVAMLIVSMLYVFIVVLAVVKALQGQRLMIPGISTYAGRLSARD